MNPIGLELKLEARLGDLRVRGIIDRLDLDADGELVVTDYKTGSVPGERYEGKSLAGVHIYAMLCEQMLGRRPAAGAALLPLEARGDHRDAHRSRR